MHGWIESTMTKHMQRMHSDIELDVFDHSDRGATCHATPLTPLLTKLTLEFMSVALAKVQPTGACVA